MAITSMAKNMAKDTVERQQKLTQGQKHKMNPKALISWFIVILIPAIPIGYIIWQFILDLINLKNQN